MNHPANPEPIPDGIVYGLMADNFYDERGQGQGLDFYRKWHPRKSEFPRSKGFGEPGYVRPSTDGGTS